MFIVANLDEAECYNYQTDIDNMTPREQAYSFVEKLNDIILFPLIYLLSGVALLVFLYGASVYILKADNETAREEGKKHITFGLIGLVIMVSAWTLLTIAAGTFGLSKQADCARDPTAPGCEDAFRLP